MSSYVFRRPPRYKPRKGNRSVGAWSVSGTSRETTAAFVDAVVSSTGDRETTAGFVYVAIQETNDRESTTAMVQAVVSTTGDRETTTMFVYTVVQEGTIPADPTGLTVVKI